MSPRLLLRLQGGDTLLVQASAQAIGQFEQNRTFVVTREEDEATFRSEKLPLALGIIGLVVALAAQLTGADPFSFVLVVTFAASGALLTPIGYQTNLMVYGPGGYRFTEFLQMGAPLQVLLASVTCGGIWMIWGV